MRGRRHDDAALALFNRFLAAGKTTREALDLVNAHGERHAVWEPISLRAAQRWRQRFDDARRTGDGFGLAHRADAQRAVGSGAVGDSASPAPEPTADGGMARAAMPGLAITGPAPHPRPTMDALIREAVAAR